MLSARLRSLRSQIDRGDVTVGTWLQIPNVHVAEMLGSAGYDWVAVDMEHGSISWTDLPAIFAGIECAGSIPLVRVPEPTEIACRRALDAGAGGVIIPMVDSTECAARLASACRWPPSGTRGVGYARFNRFGAEFDPESILVTEPLVIVMLESVAAVREAQEIATAGVDAIMIGPYDLSASLGAPGAFETKKFCSAVAAVLQASRDAGCACGIHVVEPSPTDVARRVEEGFRFIAYGIDTVFLRLACARPTFPKS